MFGKSVELTKAYLDVKYGNVTKEECQKVIDQANELIIECKKAKEEIYKSGPKVHGARQQSQLDMIDIWENKACAIYDNVTKIMLNLR